MSESAFLIKMISEGKNVTEITVKAVTKFKPKRKEAPKIARILMTVPRTSPITSLIGEGISI